eukprot:GHVT01005113.1.p1 GENE.GHVT01005113.1~~GHVT01005113.1.p1  ORF type:complete len:102 (+),score=7.45 GHVT01005113.1:330-635(+)
MAKPGHCLEYTGAHVARAFTQAGDETVATSSLATQPPTTAHCRRSAHCRLLRGRQPPVLLLIVQRHVYPSNDRDVGRLRLSRRERPGYAFHRSPPSVAALQ